MAGWSARRVTWSCSAMLAPTTATRSARAEWPASGRRPADSSARTALDRPGDAAATPITVPRAVSTARPGRAVRLASASATRSRGLKRGLRSLIGRRSGQGDGLHLGQLAVDDVDPAVGVAGDVLVVGDDDEGQAA